MCHDVTVLLAMTLSGALFGLLYDLIRSLRRTFKVGIVPVWVSDFLYWLTVGIATIYLILILNNGTVRAYEFCGLCIGAILYYFLLSKYILKLLVFIFEKILKFFNFIFKILLTPMSFLYKILIVPIINIKKGCKHEKNKKKE